MAHQRARSEPVDDVREEHGERAFAVPNREIAEGSGVIGFDQPRLCHGKHIQHLLQPAASALWGDVVLEIEPEPPAGGKIVWQWRALDHLIQDFDAARADYGPVAEHPGRIDINGDHRDRPPLTAAQRRERDEMEQQLRGLGYIGGSVPGADDPDEDVADPKLHRSGDWLHTNAISIGPRGNVVMSMHFINQVVSIASDYQSIEWRLGGPESTFTMSDELRFSGQHTAAEVETNRVLLFENFRRRQRAILATAGRGIERGVAAAHA